MTIRAVIVGIDAWEEPGWDTRSGPVANALAIATWLIGIKVPPEEIHLFLSLAEVPPPLDRCPLLPATDGNIRNFLNEDLAGDCVMGSRLLFYWSGHGATRGDSDQRLLFPADYRKTRPHLVYNVDQFFRQLRTTSYRCFDEMIALIDACGVKSEAPTKPPEPLDLAPAWSPNHLIYYATPEDGFATAGTDPSSFTSSALAVLRHYEKWPDQREFADALDKRLEALDLPRFRLSYKGDEVGGKENIVYGKAPADAEPAVDELIETLLGVSYDPAALHHAYRATTSTIGGRVAGIEAEDVVGMVRELAGLGDAGGGRVSSGLIQFVLRAAQLSADLRPSIERWLAANDRAAPPGLVGEERRRLAQEGERKLLLFLFDYDHVAKQPKEPSVSLRNDDLTLVQGLTFGDLKSAACPSLEAWAREIFVRLDQAGLADNLEVHVVSDPEFIDREYHRLPGIAEEIGQLFPVTIHYTERFNRPNTPRAESWRRQFKDLMGLKPCDPIWRELTPDCALPREGMPWFVGPRGGSKASPEDKNRLRRLLQNGAPLVYWSHTGIDAGIAERLRLLAAQGPFSQLPNLLRESRDRDEALGVNGSLLWDDPAFQSFYTSRGIAWT